ncbi:MAG: hypothetical protein IKY52_13470 [Clostridia bacterium]|nr:hypothetical protein [Clostridia bacterium]
MYTIGKCKRCGEGVLAGDFCYRIGSDYWCRSCISRAAVIAAEERPRPAPYIMGERFTGRYREREIGLGHHQNTGTEREGANGSCRKSW